MAELVAFYPAAPIRGYAVLGMARAIGERTPAILAKHSLGNVQADDFYPQQARLNTLHKMAGPAANAMFDVIAVAKEISPHMPLPPQRGLVWRQRSS